MAPRVRIFPRERRQSAHGVSGSQSFGRTWTRRQAPAAGRGCHLPAPVQVRQFLLTQSLLKRKESEVPSLGFCRLVSVLSRGVCYPLSCSPPTPVGCLGHGFFCGGRSGRRGAGPATAVAAPATAARTFAHGEPLGYFSPVHFSVFLLFSQLRISPEAQLLLFCASLRRHM